MEKEDEMENINRIMTAIDLSEYAEETLRYAAELAMDLEAELTVVNVINQRDVDAVKKISQFVDDISVDHYIEEQKKERNHQIEELLKKIWCPGLNTEVVFRIGVPYIELVEASKESNADLVVMGVKGRSNIRNVLFGSTAEKMFRRCPVPLLSLRHRK
jgi:nucleotide-binding universal stress UspA family protein